METTTPIEQKARHPAKYTDVFLPIFADELVKYNCHRVLDPFAGTGKLVRIRDLGYTGEIFLNELEPEWALQNVSLADNVNVGDAETLPYKSNLFDAICTSPTYGNRMADKHNARDSSKRNTYTHTLGRQLSEGNTGGMQWGAKYREKHERIYAELTRCLANEGIFILNMSDHIRKGETVPVTEWHVSTLQSLGFNVLRTAQIRTERNGFGANAQLRVEYESVITLQLLKPTQE